MFNSSSYSRPTIADAENLLKKHYGYPSFRVDLFERLRQLRKELATRERVPPYIIIADIT